MALSSIPVLEGLLAVATVVAAVLWIRNPGANYEPWTVLFGGLTAVLEGGRRRISSARKLTVFLSVGATYTQAQEEYVREFERAALELGLLQLDVGRHSHQARQPVLEIRERIKKADAVVVLAFTRFEVIQGVEKPGANRGDHEEGRLKNIKYPTIWNQIEAGIAYGLGKPLMVILEKGMKQEAMLKDRFEFQALTTPLDPKFFSSEVFREKFSDFLKISRSRSWYRL